MGYAQIKVHVMIQQDPVFVLKDFMEVFVKVISLFYYFISFALSETILCLGVGEKIVKLF